MLRSMTGYGRGSCSREGFGVTVELRSVNHRYADFFLRVPRELHIFEDRIRSLLKKEIRRGRVEVNITLSGSPAGEEIVVVNEALALSYYRALEGLAERLELPLNMGLGELIQLPEVLQAPGAAPGEDILWPLLEEALQEALQNLVRRRSEEGDNLSFDLKAGLGQVEVLVGELAGLAPAVLEEQKQRLEAKLTGALGAHFDENRLLMECAVLAERADIHEEMVRLGSHLSSFKTALAGESPAGRRLDFLAQEIFREINTVGAKSQDYRLAALVVEVKSELEKIREQIQNIE